MVLTRKRLEVVVNDEVFDFVWDGNGSDEIALSLALEIAKLHNSIQLRSYTNYYDCYQVILTTIC